MGSVPVGILAPGSTLRTRKESGREAEDGEVTNLAAQEAERAPQGEAQDKAPKAAAALERVAPEALKDPEAHAIAVIAEGTREEDHNLEKGHCRTPPS